VLLQRQHGFISVRPGEHVEVCPIQDRDESGSDVMEINKKMKNKVASAQQSIHYEEDVVNEGHLLGSENSEKILRSIKIPPQPLTLLSLKKELSKEYPESKIISEIISKDMPVAAGVIKTINSSFFALESKIDNIPRAVNLLGMSNVVNIVNSFSLKEALREYDHPDMDDYLDSANDMAIVTARLAKDLAAMDPDSAYILGLFHDVGIPMLLQKFDNYAKVLQYAYSSADELLTDVEDYNLKTNHAVVGYYVCKTWNMSELISLAILNHHNLEELLLTESDKFTHELKTAVALLAMAEYLTYAYHGRAERTHWTEESSLVLSYLDLTEEEFELTKSTIFESLGE